MNGEHDGNGPQRFASGRPSHTPDGTQRLVLVTGPSGAGRTTAIRALEDVGFEVIDNLPLSLIPRLLADTHDMPLALGIDVRNRDFSTHAVLDLIDGVEESRMDRAEVLYLDCRSRRAPMRCSTPPSYRPTTSRPRFRRYSPVAARICPSRFRAFPTNAGCQGGSILRLT
jgi:hypothetical protein